MASLFHSRNAVSQHVAHTSPPSRHSAVLVHQVILLHSSAVALFTAEPAVLWLCRHQDGKDAVRHFQKQAKKANEKRYGLFPLEPSFRRDLYQKGIQLGLDGSIVGDDMTVYVPDWMSMELPHPMQEIDYFHGMLDGHAVCQTMEDEVGLYDINMLNPDVGFVAFNIRKIQRLFRSRRP